jgi:nucleoside-diphosphate-sugar epimerase
VVGVARRPSGWSCAKTEFVEADIASAELGPLVRGADAVVHVAWLFQPTHRPDTTWNSNVLGSMRLFDAVAEEGVPALVHASSVGAYSPGPQDRAVDESWPTHGWPGAAYTREKSYLERYLDGFEARFPAVRVVRVRPGFIFKRESASQQRRLFGGPLIPQSLARPGLLPVLPDLPGLRAQIVHTDDVADAFRRCVLQPVSGAFNVAVDQVVDARWLAGLLHARPVRTPVRLVRTAVALAWRLHAVPASPGLFDAVLRLPLMDCSRARRVLGWSPAHSADQVIEEFLTGLRERAGMPTAPLDPHSGGRLREFATGVGQRP